MVMDLDLPVRRKKGCTDGFTLGVTQGPIPRLINAETRKLFICHVVDIASRNGIMISLVLHLVSKADGQVSCFLLQEQLVNFNLRVFTFPHLGSSNSLRLEFGSMVGDLFANLDVGFFSRMVEIVAKEDSDSKRDIRTTKKGILNVAESKLPGIFHDLLHRFPFRRLRPVKIQLLANPGVRGKDWSCHVEKFEVCEP